MSTRRLPRASPRKKIAHIVEAPLKTVLNTEVNDILSSHDHNSRHDTSVVEIKNVLEIFRTDLRKLQYTMENNSEKLSTITTRLSLVDNSPVNDLMAHGMISSTLNSTISKTNANSTNVAPGNLQDQVSVLNTKVDILQKGFRHMEQQLQKKLQPVSQQQQDLQIQQQWNMEEYIDSLVKSEIENLKKTFVRMITTVIVTNTSSIETLQKNLVAQQESFDQKLQNLQALSVSDHKETKKRPKHAANTNESGIDTNNGSMVPIHHRPAAPNNSNSSTHGGRNKHIASDSTASPPQQDGAVPERKTVIKAITDNSTNIKECIRRITVLERKCDAHMTSINDLNSKLLESSSTVAHLSNCINELRQSTKEQQQYYEKLLDNHHSNSYNNDTGNVFARQPATLGRNHEHYNSNSDDKHPASYSVLIDADRDNRGDNHIGGESHSNNEQYSHNNAAYTMGYKANSDTAGNSSSAMMQPNEEEEEELDLDSYMMRLQQKRDLELQDPNYHVEEEPPALSQSGDFSPPLDPTKIKHAGNDDEEDQQLYHPQEPLQPTGTQYASYTGGSYGFTNGSKNSNYHTNRAQNDEDVTYISTISKDNGTLTLSSSQENNPIHQPTDSYQQRDEEAFTPYSMEVYSSNNNIVKDPSSNNTYETRNTDSKVTATADADVDIVEDAIDGEEDDANDYYEDDEFCSTHDSASYGHSSATGKKRSKSSATVEEDRANNSKDVNYSNKDVDDEDDDAIMLAKIPNNSNSYNGDKSDNMASNSSSKWPESSTDNYEYTPSNFKQSTTNNYNDNDKSNTTWKNYPVATTTTITNSNNYKDSSSSSHASGVLNTSNQNDHKEDANIDTLNNDEYEVNDTDYYDDDEFNFD